MSTYTDNGFHVAIVGKSMTASFTRDSPLILTKGAGIAGLALAIGLHKKNIPFTLYEEAKEFSVVG
jgi:NADPH-dependent 2,4-dienoyl-CoA reductase/sulfur reductase-like enzyme